MSGLRGAMKFWLMKTEPSVFSFDDLLRCPRKTTPWEGVRNYQARNLMRDQFSVGDRALIYHSNCDTIGIAGVAEVVRAAYPDDSAMDRKSRYFVQDAFKKKINPWVRVDIAAVAYFTLFVRRELLKKSESLRGMMVLKKGARLSVQPVTQHEFEIICKMGKPVDV